jgi:hypothetical protein
MKYGDGEGRWASYVKERTPRTAGVRTRVVYHDDGSKTVTGYVGREQVKAPVTVKAGKDAIGKPIRKFRDDADPTKGRRIIGIDWDGTSFEQPQGKTGVLGEGYKKMIARKKRR